MDSGTHFGYQLTPKPTPTKPHGASRASFDANRQLGVTRRLAEYIVSHIESQTLAWVDQLLMNKLREFLARDGQDQFRFSPQAELVVR